MRTGKLDRWTGRLPGRICLLPAVLAAGQAFAWRSELYPENWTPPVHADFQTGKLVQDFSYAGYRLGNLENPQEQGWREADYNTAGSGAHAAHGSCALRLVNVRNAWVRRVKSFHPEENKTPTHLLSNGIRDDAYDALSAEVLVNGKPAGILWCASYRADVTHLVQTGSNTLEIRVTHTWHNLRLATGSPPANTRGKRRAWSFPPHPPASRDR